MNTGCYEVTSKVLDKPLLTKINNKFTLFSIITKTHNRFNHYIDAIGNQLLLQIQFRFQVVYFLNSIMSKIVNTPTAMAARVVLSLCVSFFVSPRPIDSK